MGECCLWSSQQEQAGQYSRTERFRGWTTGIPRAAGLRPSLILCLPDELFQKVAEDYVSVAAFQVMTGVYFLMVSSPLGDLLDPST